MQPRFLSRGKNDFLTTEKLWVQNLQLFNLFFREHLKP